MDAMLTLISQTMEKDEYGVTAPKLSSRDVFCQVQNVTRAEFFDGGRKGLNPEYMFAVFAGDYEGETICEYNGKTYGIYRVYHADGDYLELYAERKGGTNGKTS